MNKTFRKLLIEDYVKDTDESFRVGAQATFEALDLCFKDWRAQLLIRIAPRWFLSQIRSRAEEALRSNTSGKDCNHD